MGIPDADHRERFAFPISSFRFATVFSGSTGRPSFITEGDIPFASLAVRIARSQLIAKFCLSRRWSLDSRGGTEFVKQGGVEGSSCPWSIAAERSEDILKRLARLSKHLYVDSAS